MLISAQKKNKTSISITSLIDVVFILLLFFMLSSTFQKEKQIEMKSALGGATSTKVNKTHKLLLDIDNVIYIDGLKYSVNSKKFEDYLSKLLKSDDQVNLSANPNVKTQEFVKLLDILSTAGVKNLNISKSELP